MLRSRRPTGSWLCATTLTRAVRRHFLLAAPLAPSSFSCQVVGILPAASPCQMVALMAELIASTEQIVVPSAGGDSKKFQEINEAYEVLKDQEKRRLYDQVGGREHSPKLCLI